ncbi:MAG: polysaccharide deacetylase family protein [Crocinitomicaceae bacterium]|nr:polysaccharide deacetylase family protein [Crocinitomicaceae bacterium]
MFFRVPFLVQLLFKRRIWRGEDSNSVYLTFDDGPDIETTPWVLDLLKRENIKATFFCIGQNIEKHPSLFKEILNNGHRIGNHTYKHEKGTKTRKTAYLDSFGKTETLHSSNLFRPPYGRINIFQVDNLLSMGKKIIMWTWNAQDYKKSLKHSQIIDKARTIRGRDILLFHNSKKSEHNMKNSLPEVIKIVKQKELLFKLLD